MIYIFDDKKSRQVGYSWTDEKLNKYEGFIRSIYHYSQISDEVERRKIFSEGNIVLFHESFFDAEFNKRDKEALKIRRDLEAFAEKNSKFYLAFFSGSKRENSINNNVAYLPVSVLYQNLEELIHQYVNGINDLRYLLYGKNPDIEHDYVKGLIAANNSFETKKVLNRNPSENILVARMIGNSLPSVINDVEYKMLNGSSDSYFHEKTLEWLQEKQYDKIFIPLCFGKSLSDFNGLRLAIHIRCTVTPNQCASIFIYSFVGIEELINHECFNILKIKNVKLIEYNLRAFDDAINSQNGPLALTELPQEIAKLKLDVPENYEDSHSISNEWAIYRWANVIHADNSAIERIIQKVNTQIYFKYLSTIYPTSEIPVLDQSELKLNNPGQPKILYVDDDAEKGWYEIFCSILSDINGINSLDYLGDDLKKISQNEIIEKTIQKIIENNIDLVILDFRLHPDDFITKNIQDVTGYKLLKNIKEINPGIQVIVFSATTKIWNLQALQDEKADAFIIKESPDNSVDPNFTIKSISSLIKQINKCLSNSYLKEVWIMSEEIKKVFSKNPLTRKYFPKQLKEQANGIKYQNLLLQEINALFEILSTNNENRFNLAMIMLFKTVEYLNEIFYKKTNWNKQPLFFDGGAVEYYDKNSKSWKKQTDIISYFNKSINKEELVKIKLDWVKSTSNKILNLVVKRLGVTDNNMLTSLLSLTEYRNDFIHSDTSKRGNLHPLNQKEILNWMGSVTTIIKKI